MSRGFFRAGLFCKQLRTDRGGTGTEVMSERTRNLGPDRGRLILTMHGPHRVFLPNAGIKICDAGRSRICFVL